MRVMHALRDNLYDHYSIKAVGKTNMRSLDQVHKLLSRWITMISIEVHRATDTKDECTVISFQRCRWFKINFDRKKARVIARREK